MKAFFKWLCVKVVIAKSLEKLISERKKNYSNMVLLIILFSCNYLSLS